MITFTVALLLLIAGYFVYGKVVERIFSPDPSRVTPAYSKQDGIDYIPMPMWKIFMIQFLNIAGLGPIFGAIMGAKFGVSSYLWIVLGSIFAGAVHDYMAGMLSLRYDGESLPEIIGRYLGDSFKQFMRAFTVVLMVLVGAVFVAGPAGLLAKLTPEMLDVTFWIAIVFIYYVFATMLPVDKIIGKVYPLFAAALMFMAVGILVMLFVNRPDLPEITDGLANTHPNAADFPIFPMMFVSIACGAISGFHATQSPMMARCLTNEKLARPIFYGAMVAEGIVALIWAAAAVTFVGGYDQLSNYMAVEGHDAGSLVKDVSFNWLGTFGGVLAVLGVVAAPITTGDTALRSARLTIADFLHISQSKILRRILVTIPLIIVVTLLMMIDFSVLWRYFAWSNQTLSVFTLWAVTVYLARHNKPWILTMLPAMFMTTVCIAYILCAPRPEGFGINITAATLAGVATACLFAVIFLRYKTKLTPHSTVEK